MNFWDQLLASGTSAASKVVAPLGAGIATRFSNLVQRGQNKVGQLAQTVVQTTDPSNNSTKSQPPTPPTTGTPPAKNPITPGGAAFDNSTLTLAIIAGLAILYFSMKGK